MFFGVNLSGSHERISFDRNPRENFRYNLRERQQQDRQQEERQQQQQQDSKRQHAKSKYGLPYTTKWKIGIENVSKEISWQDLKDFCYDKTRIRPTSADAHRAKPGFATICCTTESDMKAILTRLNGVRLKGKAIKTVDLSLPDSNNRPEFSKPDPRKDDRVRSDGNKNERPGDNRSKTDRHGGDRPKDERHGGDRPKDERHGVDRPKDERHGVDRPKDERNVGDRPKDDRHGADRPKDERQGGDRPKDERHGGDRPKDESHHSDRRGVKRHRDERDSNHESKIIIHEVNGDRVITEKIDGGHQDESSRRGERQQKFFESDRKSVNINGRVGDRRDSGHRSSQQDGGHRGGDRGGDRGDNRGGDRGDNRGGEREDESGDHETRFAKKDRAIHKYGVPYKTKWKVRIENLSPDVSWQDLKDLFRPYADIKFSDAHKPTKGIGNVYVGSHEALKNLIDKMHLREIKGQVVCLCDESGKKEPTHSPHKRAEKKSKSK